MNVSEDRQYVIVCREHKALLSPALLFWGSLTDDDAKRSYGGYTMDIDKCERYTRDELEKWRGNLKEEYPFFDELKAKSDFDRQDEIHISGCVDCVGFWCGNCICRSKGYTNGNVLVCGGGVEHNGHNGRLEND